MQVWQDGDRDKFNCTHQGPSILIPLCMLNAQNNTSTLHMDRPRIEEVEDVDAGK